MKTMFIILLILVNGVSHARCLNPIAESEFIKAKAGVSNAGFLTCKDLPNEPCYCLDGIDRRHKMIGQVDDLDRQKYSKEDLSVCSDQTNCEINMAGKDCSTHGEGAFGVINQDYTEAYCAKPNGYFQKPGLVADSAGTATAVAADDAKVTEDAAKVSKRITRLSVLVTCAKTAPVDMTAAIQKQCLIALARELVRTKLTAAEQ